MSKKTNSKEHPEKSEKIPQNLPKLPLGYQARPLPLDPLWQSIPPFAFHPPQGQHFRPFPYPPGPQQLYPGFYPHPRSGFPLPFNQHGPLPLPQLHPQTQPIQQMKDDQLRPALTASVFSTSTDIIDQLRLTTIHQNSGSHIRPNPSIQQNLSSNYNAIPKNTPKEILEKKISNTKLKSNTLSEKKNIQKVSTNPSHVVFNSNVNQNQKLRQMNASSVNANEAKKITKSTDIINFTSEPKELIASSNLLSFLSSSSRSDLAVVFNKHSQETQTPSNGSFIFDESEGIINNYEKYSSSSTRKRKNPE
ncbi:hypothetical protein HK096_011456, partial [Nowakowskiella sp. JEL0078]